MPFYLLNEQGQFDVSELVQRETVQCTSTLSVDVEARGGESTLQLTMTIDEGSLLPLAGNIITFVGDDGLSPTYFSGVITEVVQTHTGFNEACGEVFNFEISARDPSYLLEKKITEPGRYNQKWVEGVTEPENIPAQVNGDPVNGFSVTISVDQQEFPDFIGNNPGNLMDLLAIGGEPRLQLPNDNEDAASEEIKLPYDYEIGRMNYKDAIDQIAREVGLLWWIDAEWNFHHKSFPTIYNTLQDPFFDIDDNNLNYYNFEWREDAEKWVSRVKVIGNVHDAGDVNQQNQKEGKQKREEIQVIVTDTIDKINIIRARIGYPPLTNDTNVDELPDTTPGIWITTVNAPDVYLHKESGDPDPERPDYSLLREIGEAYLLRYGQPDIVGSVNYNDRAPKVGASIIINTSTIQNIVVPIVEVTIDSSGQSQGNDQNCNRIYTYRAQFRGPSMRLRYARALTNAEILRKRPERHLKPNPPVILGANVYAEATGEVLASMPVADTIITGKILLPDYTITATEYGTIFDEYPSFVDTAPNPEAPPPMYEQTRKYYPPIKKPWTITSGFGPRIHPVTGASSDHPAIDIDAKVGKPVYAIYDGVIAIAEHNPKKNLAGKYIKLNLSDGNQALYGHLDKIIVKTGDQVKIGQIIGYSGKTGRVTGPHLHFGIKNQAGNPVNPLDFEYRDFRETT